MNRQFLSNVLVFAALMVSGFTYSTSVQAQDMLYGCDPFSSDTWGSILPSLEKKGVSFSADITQFYFGVLEGGLEETSRYAAHGDYVVNFDAGKLGIQDGLFLKIRAEHHLGESINDRTGAFLPAVMRADLPVRDSENIYVTNFLFTQFLSSRFAVFAGKLDTIDGDLNAYAHGRGKTQFSNVGFIINPVALRTIPYSTLGAGFTLLGQEGLPVFTYTLLNPTDTTRTTGLGELFEEGVAMSAELRLLTAFGGFPGHHLFGGTWSSREYAGLDQDPRILFPNVPISQESNSWSLYWNFDQALVTDCWNPAAHWGVFGRAGIADSDTNPISYFLSLGLGGKGLLNNRPNDSFGLGYFYSGTSGDIAPFIERLVGGIGDGQGIECFYRVQITENIYVTPDLQIVIPARDQVDTAYIAGLRALLTF
ncbi:Carbohydrate-selective porin OprB [Planctomycetales bacterium 10988]|nr:Carbohydrate-selective porin OprB [Planctomycetales bacterium 10988]